MASKRDLLTQSPTQWAQENNNAAKQAATQNMPLWQQYGFSSEEAYNNVYNQPAPTKTIDVGIDDPVRETPADPSDPFGAYLTANPNKRDAWAYLEAVLKEYGLGELNDFVKNNIIEGRSDVEIQQRLREQDVYKKRFAVIEERKALGLPAMSETEVVEWEKEAIARLRRAQIPQGMWDTPEDLKKFMVNDWSIAELESVLNDGYMSAQNADPVVRDEITRLFGPGALTAFFIDPDKTENMVMEQYKAARAGAQARLTGYGAIAREEAERVAALGITEDQQRAGFGNLAQNRELFQDLPGQSGGGISRDTQFAAAFQGDANAQSAIEKVAKERANRFANKGAFSSGDQGFAGLGRAR